MRCLEASAEARDQVGGFESLDVVARDETPASGWLQEPEHPIPAAAGRTPVPDPESVVVVHQSYLNLLVENYADHPGEGRGPHQA